MTVLTYTQNSCADHQNSGVETVHQRSVLLLPHISSCWYVGKRNVCVCNSKTVGSVAPLTDDWNCFSLINMHRTLPIERRPGSGIVTSLSHTCGTDFSRQQSPSQPAEQILAGNTHCHIPAEQISVGNSHCHIPAEQISAGNSHCHTPDIYCHA